MRSQTLIALIVALGGCFMVASYLDRVADKNHQRDRDTLVSAVDDLWLQALHVGADPDRWPDVVFLSDFGTPLARTRCSRPRPEIQFNDDLLQRYRWHLHNMTVAHEMAHIMVCLDGKADEWRDHHGEHWENWVRLLVPRDVADDIIADQHIADQEEP